MNIGLEAIVNYIPSEVLYVNEYYSYLNAALDRHNYDLDFGTTLPIKVHRLRDFSAAEMMAVAVGKKALEHSGLSVDDIDALIVTQTGGRQSMPLVGAYVHLNMGFRKDMIVRNVIDDNTSFIDSINLASTYVLSGECRRVLIIAVAAQIGGQTNFCVDLTDPICMYYGDGAAAAIVSSVNLKCEIKAFDFETRAVNIVPGYSKNSNNIEMNFTTPTRLLNRDLAEDAFVDDVHGDYLKIFDPDFKGVVTSNNFFTGCIERAARKCSIGLNDLDMIIASHYGYCEPEWKAELESHGICQSVYKNKSKFYGNMSVADIGVDLADFVDNGELMPGMNIACWTPTFGVQASTLIIKWL